MVGQPSTLTNDRLAKEGNASLLLGTLGRTGDLVWFVPGGIADGSGQRSLTSLLPGWVGWVALQLLLVVGVCMLWRGRRLGRLVPEPLPVAVRAVETTEGRARMYRRARAHDRAAAELREARAGPAARRPGCPARRPPADVVAVLAQRTGIPGRDARRPPVRTTTADDAGLVRLARSSTSSTERYADRDRPARPQPAPRRPARRPTRSARTADRARAALHAVRGEVAKAVVGQDAAVTGLVIALLARGHVLLEGVPGVAKTLLVRALSASLSLQTTRVQFTPDLMPGDVTGSLVYDARTAEFSFREGPVFTNLLLADEINRTPPKTQAVAAGGDGGAAGHGRRPPAPLPEPFVVRRDAEPGRVRRHLPAPEAQLDRFLLKLTLPLPPREDEVEVLGRHAAGFDPRDLAAAGVRAVAGPAELAPGAGRGAPRCRSQPEVLGYVVDVARATRAVSLAAPRGQPRGATALLARSRAWAWLSGRDYVTPDDVKALARPTLRHRVSLRPEAELEGVTRRGGPGRRPGHRAGPPLRPAHGADRTRRAAGAARRGRPDRGARGVAFLVALARCWSRSSAWTWRWPGHREPWSTNGSADFVRLGGTTETVADGRQPLAAPGARRPARRVAAVDGARGRIATRSTYPLASVAG